MADDRKWYEYPFEMFQTNLRETDTAFDVEQVLDYIEAHGADTWLINAGGILAFHPSDLPSQTRNPFLERRPSGDLLGDAFEAARRRGVKVLGRMDFSKVTRQLADQHPEWCYVSPDGNWQEYNGLVSVCPNGNYYQSCTFEILDEVMQRYPLDGFFFNWFSFNEVDYSKVRHGVCHCSACQAAFREHSGQELPRDVQDPAYFDWQRWTDEILNDLTSRLAERIVATLPEAGLLGRRHAQITFHEANNAISRPLWHHATGEAVSAAKAIEPTSPVLVNSVTFVDMPYRLAGEEAEHFAQYLIQTIARGANPSTYIMGVPGDIPLKCLDLAGEITRFHRDNSEIYHGLRSRSPVALVRQDALSVPSDVYAATRAEFVGMYTALQERHVPFDIVPQESLEAIAAGRGLGDYRLVVLPDLRAVTRDQAEVLDEYVAAGGRILATGATGLLRDEMLLQSLGAVRRVARRDRQELLWASYVEVGEPGDTGWSTIPLVGAYDYVESREGAELAHRVLAPAAYGPPEKCYGQQPTDHPGWLRADHGEGSTIYVPWTVGRTYHDFGQREVRDLLVDLAHDLLGETVSVSTDLPEQVELMLAQQGEKTVVHLINMSGASTRSFRYPVPVRGGTLTFQGAAGRRVRSLVGGSTCETEVVDDALVVHLPVVDRFEVIVLE